METPNNQWVFSHTQLALFRLCPRRYYYAYVLGEKEPMDERADYSSVLVHPALEAWLRYGSEVDWPAFWQQQWAEFTALHPSTKLDLEPAQATLTAYQASPLEGEVELVEERTYTTVAGYNYVSKPDFVLRREGRRWTVDFKFSMSDWPPKPLLPFDDQLLGQALTHDAEGFIRVSLRWGKDRPSSKKPSELYMTVEEYPVDPVLAEEWQGEVRDTCDQIQDFCYLDIWPKSTGACHAFGRPCPGMVRCKFGLAGSLDLTGGQRDANMVDEMEGNRDAG